MVEENTERHPLDELIAQVEQEKQGRRRSLIGLLRRTVRRRTSGDEEGEAAFFALALTIIGLAIGALAVLAACVWLVWALLA